MASAWLAAQSPEASLENSRPLAQLFNKELKISLVTHLRSLEMKDG